MAQIRIPLALPIVEVTIAPVEYGDPYSLRITLPPSACGTIVLPRSMFSDAIVKQLDGGNITLPETKQPRWAPGSLAATIGEMLELGQQAQQPEPEIPEIVERVARAVCAADTAGFIGFTQAEVDAIATDHFLPWNKYEIIARAAFTALREPTEAMLEVVKYDEYGWGEANWRAMIDAALGK